ARLVPRASTLTPSTTLFRSHLADALPLGLICAAVWSTGNPDALRAQGRIEQYFGGGRLAPATVRAYAEAVTDVVADSLRADSGRSEEHTSELQSRENLVCRL